MRNCVAGVVAVIALMVFGGAIGSGQSSALRIVVVSGEDGVNIIGKGTAVAPVVEVRDRNDLPVSSASVVFLLGGNNAKFAGNAARFEHRLINAFQNRARLVEESPACLGQANGFGGAFE